LWLPPVDGSFVIVIVIAIVIVITIAIAVVNLYFAQNLFSTSSQKLASSKCYA